MSHLFTRRSHCRTPCTLVVSWWCVLVPKNYAMLSSQVPCLETVGNLKLHRRKNIVNKE